MPKLTKPTSAELEDLGFCLGQAFVWLSKCYVFGDADYRAKYPDQAARRDAALANGVATLSARVDLTGLTAAFVLNLDEGPNGPLEIPLFNEGFMPKEPTQ